VYGVCAALGSGCLAATNTMPLNIKEHEVAISRYWSPARTANDGVTRVVRRLLRAQRLGTRNDPPYEPDSK
jgi:hypothetical protein